jgi:hypothetical protein
MYLEKIFGLKGLLPSSLVVDRVSDRLLHVL